MRKKINAVRKGKRLTALLVVAVTVAYLTLTAAFAQNSITSNNGAKVAYDPDYLSFGDMYGFTETAYNASNYSLDNDMQTVSLYNNKGKNQSEQTKFSFYKYYGTVTTGDHANVSNDGIEMQNREYSVYHSGYTKSTAPAAVAGETVPVLTTTGKGTYTLVPGSKGAYRLYVYAVSDPTGKVKYELIDSYAKFNAYNGTPSQSLRFTRVADTDYWYAPIEVEHLSWSAYQLSAAAETGTTTSSTTPDKVKINGGDAMNSPQTVTGAQKTNTTLSTDKYYYNVWTATEILYDTLLAVQWESTVQLGPVTKLGDSITITNSDPSMGSLTAKNAFGETVAAGSAVFTAHAPIYVTAVPASAESAFSGFGTAEVSLVNAEQGIYKYNFESTGTLAGSWTKKENLPTVKISGAYTGTMDFFAATSASTQVVSGTASNYTLTVDYTGATDVRSVSYTVASAGQTTGSGTITQTNNTIRVSAQWDSVTVSISATGATGASYTAVFTVNVGNTGLADVAQIGTTNYQFIEDALAAATNGQTITIISPNVSFVDTDTVPAAWTADSNGDGCPDGYTVKAGVKLVIPYSANGSTTPNNASHDYPYSLFSEEAGISSPPYLETSPSFEYRKLTLPAGKTMYVKGQVNTGGTIYGTGYAGCTLGSAFYTYSVLELNGDMEVQDGGIVSSCGYIYGDGTLYARSGAKLYQPLVVCDYRGGGYVVGAAGKSSSSYGISPMQSGEKYTSPFDRYTMQNIQTTVQMDEGALMHGYCDLYAGSQHNRTTGVLIGSTSRNVDGLIQLKAGSKLTAAYDKSDVVAPYNNVGRTDITIEGGASFGVLTLALQLKASFLTINVDIATSDLTFPVPYNYGIHLNGDGSQYDIAYSMVLLPGSTLEVGEGAVLNVGNSSTVFRFMAMDGLNDHTSNAPTSAVEISYGQKPGSNYPTTANIQAVGKSGTADLIVNGTLNINSGVNFGGVVQAGSDNAKLVMAAGASSSCKVQIGVVGSYSLGKTYHLAGATVRELTAQVIDRGTGKRTDIVAGRTYYGADGSDSIAYYTYQLYTASTAPTRNESYTDALNATVEGSWYNYTATIHRVDSNGNILGTEEAYYCHGADVSAFYLDSSCTTPATTVTADKMVLYAGEGNFVAKVVWADGVMADNYYPTLRNAVQAAKNTGDRVVLLKDITQTAAVAVDKTQNLTIDLDGHTVSYSTTPIINNGALTLDLNGGSITNEVNGTYTTAEAFTNNKGATATVDLKGGSITYQYSETLSYGTQVIRNSGTLTVMDAGTGEKGILRSTASSSASITNAGATENFAAVLRNTGSGVSLTVKNVKLVQEQTANNNSVGIVNHNGAQIPELTDVEISCPNGYAVYNLGGTIAKIDGGDIQGRWGIYNINIRTGNQAGSGYTVSNEAVITSIADVRVTATYQHALYNRGRVGSIGGNAYLGAPNNALYNHNGWYYDSYAPRYSDSGMVRTYYYDLDNQPTIEQITGAAVISATTTDFGIRNYGRINEISGDVQISAKANYGLGLDDGGSVGSISGKVTITANAYAVRVYGQGIVQMTRTYAGTSDKPTTISGNTLKEIYTYGKVSEIGTISGGSGTGVTLKSNGNYALSNYGKIGSITGKVTMTAAQNTLVNQGDTANSSYTYEREYTNPYTASTEYKRTQSYVRNVTDGSYIGMIGGAGSDIQIIATNYYAISNNGYIEELGSGVTVQATTGNSWSSAILNGEERQTGYVQVITNEGTVTEEGDYTGKFLTRYDRTYTYDAENYPATIASIHGVTITTANQYALRNSGKIGSITDSVISAKSYGIHNYGSGPYDGDRVGLQYYFGTALFGTNTSHFNQQFINYNKGQSSIGTIDGCTITATTGGYGILNGGKIGTITNNAITTKTERAISNTENTITAYANVTENFITKGTDGKYVLPADLVKQESWTYDLVPAIELIGDGNKLSSTANTIINSGKILAVGGDGTGTKTTVDASTGVGLYNYRATCATRTNDQKITAVGANVNNGASNNVYTYQTTGASIGTVKNVQITAKTKAILNGSGESGYGTQIISELGKGLIATATDTTGYGVDTSANYATITLISGGDYKSGNTSAASREYAIRKPDEQTYPNGLSLSAQGVTESVTLADGTKADGYYFITDGKFAAAILEDGHINQYPTLQAAVEAYPAAGMDGSAYIQMTDDSTEPGFTIGKDVYLDLNGKAVTLTGADNSVGTLAIADGADLYGMDNETNGYVDTAYGKIIGTVSGNVALTYQTPAAADGTFQRYVKFEDTANNALSFHRYNISVSGYRFDFNENNTSALYFQGTFSGSDTVKQLLRDVGFDVDGTRVWWTAENTLNALAGEKYEIQVALVGDFTTDELKAPHTVYALADFLGDQANPAMSDQKTLSFWEVLQKHYEKLKAKADRSPEEEADLAILERVLNGAQTAAAQETAD